jgi:hypothetical protein
VRLGAIDGLTLGPSQDHFFMMDEHKVLGDEGFERSADKVAKIEVQLGINDLKQFTPGA